MKYYLFFELFIDLYEVTYKESTIANPRHQVSMGTVVWDLPAGKAGAHSVSFWRSRLLDYQLAFLSTLSLNHCRCWVSCSKL